MKTYLTLLIALLLLGGVSIGCSDSSAEEEERIAEREERERRRDRDRDKEDEPQNLEEALSNLGKSLEEMGEALGGKSGVEPVDFRDLREVLPRRVRGMEKGSSSGETTGVLGIRVSTVEQVYRNEDNERIEITIVDLGSLKNAAMFGMDWLNVEFDREDDTGFERTTTIEGYPAFEKCQQMGEYENCEVHLIVAERFVVDLEGRRVPIRKLRDVIDDLELRKLEKMRNEGVTER